MQSDNGTEFVNKIVKEFTSVSGIEHRLISTYRPRTNGASERMVQTATKMISKLIKGIKSEWDIYIPFVQYSINQKIVKRHNSLPFYALFGRKALAFDDYSKIPISKDFSYSEKQNEEIIKEIEERTNFMKEVLFPSISELSRKSVEKYKNDFDDNKKIKEFKIGSYVMIKKV